MCIYIYLFIYIHIHTHISFLKFGHSGDGKRNFSSTANYSKATLHGAKLSNSGDLSHSGKGEQWVSCVGYGWTNLFLSSSPQSTDIPLMGISKGIKWVQFFLTLPMNSAGSSHEPLGVPQPEISPQGPQVLQMLLVLNLYFSLCGQLLVSTSYCSGGSKSSKWRS